jgi:hypothetical protein
MKGFVVVIVVAVGQVATPLATVFRQLQQYLHRTLDLHDHLLRELQAIVTITVVPREEGILIMVAVEAKAPK